MIHHEAISDIGLRSKIRKQKICFAGNIKLKIYGTLHCSSGKRMKRANRVFFSSNAVAISNSYRPCGHCMKSEYKIWKLGISKYL